MKFIFLEKSRVEMNVITDILEIENIPYKLKRKVKETYFIDDFEDEDFVIKEEIFDIHCDTDVNHFDFVKHIADKKIADRVKLERCFYKKGKRNVRKLHKKDNANPDTRNKTK